MKLHRVSDPKVRLVADLGLIGRDEIEFVMYGALAPVGWALGALIGDLLRLW